MRKKAICATRVWLISHACNPLVHAPFVLTSRQYSLLADDGSWAQKQKNIYTHF